MRLWTLFFLLCFPLISFAALPPEALEYLNKIPEKKLTLPFVVATAVKNADEYRIIAYEYGKSEIESLQIGKITDTAFTLDSIYKDDNSVKPTPFQARRERVQTTTLGLGKFWNSGTQTRFGLVTGSVNQEFAAGGAPFPGFLTEYKQAALTFDVEQDLLKNSFGFSLRKKREAARLRGQAVQWGSRSRLEETTIGIIQQYYQAWFMQQRVRSLKERVDRQTRLVKILRRRSKKGAIEKPDLIQVEALLASSNTQLAQARADLSQQWDLLVISLKLPRSFLSIDPLEVPTTIDDPTPFSLRLCGLKEPKKTAEIAALEKKLEALKADFRASKNDSLPDLKLVAGYSSNSLDGRLGNALDQALTGLDEDGNGIGPVWSVGIKMKWALSNSEARAVRTEKYLDRETTSAQLIQAVDKLKIDWKDQCRRLKVEAENEKTYLGVVNSQKERVKAEGRRFRLGRINVNQLVTAEDDLGTWELNSQQKSIEVRSLAWSVQKNAGEIFNRISPYVDEMMKAGQQ